MANSDPIEWRLIDTDLVTVLGILPAAESHLYLALNEPGSGELKIPMMSTLADSVGSGMFAQASYRGAVRGGFFVENISKGLADSAEGAGQQLSISGRGALALLDDAIVWDDGTGSSTRDFVSMTKAEILITLIDEAQARGALLNLTYDFTSSLDSDGETWVDSETYQLNVGKSLLDVVRDFAKTGIDFDVTPNAGEFVLSAYMLGKGSDQSETVYFRTGMNCEEITSDERGDKIENALRVAYKSGYISVSDAVSIAARRRRERLLDVKVAQTTASATTIGAAKIELSKDPKKSISVKIYDGKGPRAFVDYDLGDYIMLDVEGVETRYRIFGIQPDWAGDQFSDVIVELNSILYENDIQMAQDLDWLMNQWETARDANLLAVSYWAAIGNSSDSISAVFAVHVLDNKLYVGGAFTRIGGINATNLAVYDIETGQWSDIGGADDWVLCFASRGTDLYFSGWHFLHGVKKYDTGTGTISDVGRIDMTGVEELSGRIQALEFIGTDLYATGFFVEAESTVGGVVAVSSLAKWDTVTEEWLDVGGGITESDGVSPGVGNALAVIGSTLFIGGDFAKMGGSSIDNVGTWNGSAFSALGAGLDGIVRALAVNGANVVAGGAFTDKIKEWDGAAWSTFGGGVNGTVYALAVYLADVYAVGNFTDAGNHIARCSAGEWSVLDTGLNNTSYAIALNNDDVYVGGLFTTAGDKPAKMVAAYFSNFESLANYLENSGNDFDMAAAIHNAPASAITDNDEVGFWEDVSNALRKITWANIKATLKTYFDTLYVALTGNQTIAGIKTFSSDPIVPDEVYDATAWNGNLEPPTKNAVRDKIESMGSGGTPGGSDTEFQYNDGGVFNGTPGFYWDETNGIINLGATGGPPSATTNTLLNLLAKATDANVLINGYAFGTGSTVNMSYNGFRSAGSKASPGAVLSGYVFNSFGGAGHDGSAWITASEARMQLRATENHDASHHGAGIYFEGTPNASTIRAEFGKLLSTGFDVPTGAKYLVNGAQHTHTTVDVADSTNKRYVTDANLTVIGNTSGTNSGNETATTIGALIGGAADATPNDSDFVATSLTAGGVLKKITWTNVKAFLKTYWDTLYAPVSKGVTNGDSHDHSGGDGGGISTAIAEAIATGTLKNPPVDADSFPINDVAGGNVFKRVSMVVMRTYVKALTDTLYQTLDATLTAFAALVGSANKIIRFTGVDTFELVDLAYGTWTPTGVTGTNVAAMTVHVMNYTRVGSQVTFNGLVEIDPTAIGAFTCYLTLPIASNFTNSEQCNGNGSQPGTGTPNIISIREDTTNDRMQLDGYSLTTANTFYRLVGGYIIN